MSTSKRPWQAAPYAGLAALFYGIYLLTANQIFSFDAVTNAIACEAGQPIRWFHPNHLLYPFTGVGYYHLERFLGYDGLSIYSLARFNSLCMAVGLGVLSWRLSSIVGRGLALSLSGVLGSTYAWWEFAVDGRAVGASMLWATLIAGEILAAAHRNQLGKRVFWRLAAYSVLYIGFHGIGVFHMATVSLFIWSLAPKGQKRSWVGKYLGTVTAIVGLSYVFLFRYLYPSGSFHAMASWMLGYAGFHGASEALSSAYWSTSISSGLSSAFRGWHTALLYPLWCGPVLLSAAIGGIVLFMLCFAFLFRKHLPPTHQKIIVWMSPWVACTAIFLFFWSPTQQGFWLHVLVPAWVVLAMHASQSRRPKLQVYVFTLIAVLFFTYNELAGILPHAKKANNVGLRRLTEIRQNLQSGDVLLSLNGFSLPGIEVLRTYFYPEIAGGTLSGRLFAFREKDLTQMTAQLNKDLSRGRRVYFAEDFFSEDNQRSVETNANLPVGAIKQFLHTFYPVRSMTLRDYTTIFEMRAARKSS